jgi:GNAT acetyltransferase-like protein
MSTPLQTRILSESEYGAWVRLLKESPQGSAYGMPEYLEALCAAAGGSYRIVVAHRNDELAGGVALYERPSAHGLRVSPRPLLYYNGLVLREHPSKYPSQKTSRTIEACTALERAISAMGYDGITLRNSASLTDVRSFLQQGWVARPGYSYVVSITDVAAAWQRVEQNLRRLVGRCTKEGIELTQDDDFDSFFRMHEETSERKGIPLYLPRSSFKSFFVRLRAAQLCHLYHARRPDGQSIASQLVLAGPFGATHSVSAATDPQFLNSGVTPFLRWKVFEALSAQGYLANDLTDATLNDVAHFKSQLGGDLSLSLILERQPSSLPLHRRLWRRLRRGTSAVG